MRTTTSLERHVLLALILTFAGGGVLLCFPRAETHAQQEPNRQLVQTNSSRIGSTRRLALVIGNGAYTNAPPLKNPPNDARDMAATLKQLGFEVAIGINLDQRAMKRLIRDFGQTLKAGGSGLFYYAGHGVQSRGRNYLIPVDADIQSEAEVEDAGVDVNLLLSYLDEAQNGLNIVILDACRNNPFSRGFRSVSSGLAQVDAPTGTLIAYSTAPGRVASDGTGQNGLYTSELLKQMRVSGLSLIEMFMNVRAEVMRQTNNKQVPWEASSLVGMFYFKGQKNSSGVQPAEAATGPSLDPAAFELSYWETIKNSSDQEDFKSYLDKYPHGQFVALARNNIRRLAATVKTVSIDQPSPTKNAVGAITDPSANKALEENPTINAYVNANRFDDAFALGSTLLERNPDNLRALVSLTAAGTEQAKKHNSKYASLSFQYGAKAIELIEANKKAADMDDASWAQYRTLLPGLYQSMAILSLVRGDHAEAKARLARATQLAPSDPFNYLILAGLLNDEYQEAAKRFQSMSDGQAKADQLKKAQALLDNVIDVYAHLLALAEGNERLQPIRQQYMTDLEAYYKYRHNNSTAGMQELINKYKVPAKP